MRILHVTEGAQMTGGVAQIRLLMEAIRSKVTQTYQSLACPGRGPVAFAFEEAGFPVHRLDMRQDYDIAAMIRLGRLARAERSDIVHAHHPMAHAVALGCRHWVPFGLVVSRRVTHPIPWYPTSSWKYRSGKISCYLCVSEAVAATLRAAGVKGERCLVVGSSTDLARFRPRPPNPSVLAEFGLSPKGGRLTGGMVANYSKWKGHEVLLRALAHLEPQHRPFFLVAGRDTDGPELIAMAAQGGVSGQFRFLGWRRDVPDLLSVMDFLVCPSNSGEGSSGAIREAFAMRIPVVASDIPANVELAGEGRGWLFRAGDPVDLARAIRDLALTPEQDRGHRTMQAAEFVRRRFSIESMTEGTLNAYRRALSSREAAG